MCGLRTFHGVGLARSRLSIGKDGGLVSQQDIMKDRLQGLLKDFRLRAEGTKDVVEIVLRLGLMLSTPLQDRHRLFLGVASNDGKRILRLFSVVQRTKADHYLDTSGAGGARGRGHGWMHTSYDNSVMLLSHVVAYI
jgi:hypothetical protein